MERYLLFDSGCSKCSKIAKEAEQASGSWLEVRSLRDPTIREILDQKRPNWPWRPMLIEIDDKKVKVHAGLSMSLRLLMRLGFRRTLHLAMLIGKQEESVQGAPNPSRRGFLRESGFSLAAFAVLFGLPMHFGKSGYDGKVSAHSTSGGDGLSEIYEGFVLLPEGAPRPSFVTCSSAPILDGANAAQEFPESLGETIWLGSIEELTSYVSFPLYIPSTLPTGLTFLDATITRFVQSKEVWTATINYGRRNQEHGKAMDQRVSLIAMPQFPRPYPVSPVRVNENRVDPEKVDFLPSPGLLRPSGGGNVLLWIKDNILYTLVAEHAPHREAAIAIAQSLVRR